MTHRSGHPEEKEISNRLLYIDGRDHEILLALHAVCFLTSRHLRLLLELHPSNVSRKINRLCRHRYVVRIPRVVRQGAGAPRHVYTLDVLGRAYIAEASGIPPKERQREQSPSHPSSYSIAHSLALAGVYVALKVATREAGLDLVWWNKAEALRRYRLPSGEARSLEPDAVFSLSGPGITPTMAFLEVDRGMESSQEWQCKMRDYNDYFRTPEAFIGQWSRRPPRLLLLVTTLSPARVESLRCYAGEEWDARWECYTVQVGFSVHDEVARSSLVLHLPWGGLDGEAFWLLEQATSGDPRH